MPSSSKSNSSGESLMTPRNIGIGAVIAVLVAVLVYVNWPTPLPPQSADVQAAQQALQAESGSAQAQQPPAEPIQPRNARQPIQVR